MRRRTIVLLVLVVGLLAIGALFGTGTLRIAEEPECGFMAQITGRDVTFQALTQWNTGHGYVDCEPSGANSFKWNFGDGTSATFSNSNPFTHAYQRDGVYTVTLTMTNSAHQSATYRSPITISLAALTATFELSVSARTVTATGHVTGGIPPYTYSWIWGDGQTPSTTNPATHYYAPGKYLVQFTVRDSSATGLYSPVPQWVEIGLGTLSTGITIASQDRLTIGLVGEASGGQSPYTYSWNFGDQTTGTGQTVIHTYTASGIYRVVLTTKDSLNAEATAARDVEVSSSPLPGGANPPSVSVSTSINNLTVQFTSTVSSGTPSYTYAWSFGDGNTSTDVAPAHIYGQSGTYSVNLTVTDSEGRTGSTAFTVTVSAPGVADLTILIAAILIAVGAISIIAGYFKRGYYLAAIPVGAGLIIAAIVILLVL